MVVPNGNGHEGDPPSIAGMVPGNTAVSVRHAPGAPRCPRRSRRAVDDVGGGRGRTVWPSRLNRAAPSREQHPPCAPSPDVTPSAPSSRSSTRPPRRSSRSRSCPTPASGSSTSTCPASLRSSSCPRSSLVTSAFVTTALADGRSGVRELRSRVFRFRVSPRWYLIAFVALPGAALATAFVLAGAGPVVALASDPSIAISAVIGAIVAFALVNWWEEAAWTGFALHRLQGRIGPVRASVATTWMQAALHLPLVFIVDGVNDGRVSPENVPFYLVALFVLPIPVRMTLTWIYNASGRSVPIAGLYHAGLGVAVGSRVPAPSSHRASIRSWSTRASRPWRRSSSSATRGRLGLPARDPSRWSSARRWPPRPDLSPSEPGGPSGSPGSFRCPGGRPGASSRRGRTSRTASRSWPPPAPAGRRRWPSGPGPCPSRRSRATSARRGTASRHRPGCRPRRRATP